MSRPIKFRGLTKEINSIWIYGSLIVFQDGITCICSFDADNTEELNKTDIKSETVGQFTGLLDKNGDECYEGDLCRFSETSLYEIIMQDGCWSCKSKSFSNPQLSNNCSPLYLWNRGIEIIGNVYSNPELLKQ